MASIKLNRGYTLCRHGATTRHEAGEVISVPFGVGNELVASGVGVHWNGGAADAEPASRSVTRPVVEPVHPVARPKPVRPSPAKPHEQTKPAEAKPAEAQPSNQGE